MLPNESVDLIYADPPFNSNRNYGKIENNAFTDIWTWQEHGIVAREDIEGRIHQSSAYSQLNLCMEAFDILLDYEEKGKQGAMRAYLSFMGVRLAEMHRVLKDTGSIYLQCDCSSSHYLKVLMDKILGKQNFKNEIVWRIGWVSGFKTQAKRWIRNHDIILYYTKDLKFCFNKEYIAYPKDYTRRGENPNGKGLAVEDTWNCSRHDFLPSIQIQSWYKEKTGYPTQKPKALVKRIVKASSNESHIVLDPFCGSGTTLDVCELLKRQWIGIDCGKQAIETTIQRLAEQHSMLPQQDYDLIGKCDNIAMPEAKTLLPQQIGLGI